MRFLTAFILMAAAALTAAADNVSEQQAQTIAQQFINQTVRRQAPDKAPATVKLVRKAVNATGETDYYVFNTHASQTGEAQGFVVVSGDDRTMPVWGYSSTTAFPTNDMPENVSWWLNEYQRQLQYLRQHPEAARQPLKLSSSVAPLMTTTWKQGEPYNSEIPSIRFSLGTKKPVVGCVALAMAQMMKAHNWPDHGEGSHSYTYRAEGASASKEFSANFGATNYQWASMKDSYTSNQDATAVATLCYHAGVSVDMQYNTADNGGSGAQIYDAMKALRTYFRYDKGLDLYLRDFYPIETWEEMLRHDLDEGNPIVYGGSTANMYGHCFVFDGYDTDGRFHINWGWGGDYNGYFVSSVLNSGRANADFSYWQQAILGAKPDYDGTSTGANLRPLTGYLIDFEAVQKQVAVGGNVNLKIEGITFLGEGSYTLNYCGVRVYSEDEQTVVLDEWQADCSEMRVGESYAIDETAALGIPKDIASGTYHIYAVYALDDEDGKNPVRYERPSTKAKYIKMEVKNGTAYFSDGEVTPEPVVETPTLAANPGRLVFSGAVGKTYTQSVTVRGQHLEDGVTATLTATDAYSIDRTSITAEEAAQGAVITVTYSPTELGETSATLTLSSQGASDVVVNIAGTALDETPLLTVDPENLTFETEEGTTATQTFSVGGNFIESETTLTLAGDEAFRLSTTAIAASKMAEGPATITVTFEPEAAGSYEAVVTISAEGAQDKTVTLKGTATAKEEPQPQPSANSSYLDIANYAAMAEAGNIPDGMRAVYVYTEYPEEEAAWLTLSAWGAWQDDAAQDWVTVDATYSYNTRWTAQADAHMLGHDAYFDAGVKVIDSESTETFYVTNCTQAIAYGHNYSSLTNARMEVYECSEGADGLTVAATPVDAIEGGVRAEFILASSELDPGKIYKVELTNKNSEVYEFGFRTSLKGDEPKQSTGIRSTVQACDKAEVHNLQGQQVSRSQAAKGIYIVGRKKVIIK